MGLRSATTVDWSPPTGGRKAVETLRQAGHFDPMRSRAGRLSVYHARRSVLSVFGHWKEAVRKWRLIQDLVVERCRFRPDRRKEEATRIASFNEKMLMVAVSDRKLNAERFCKLLSEQHRLEGQMTAKEATRAQKHASNALSIMQCGKGVISRDQRSSQL
jgi:hypothetical protein